MLVTAGLVKAFNFYGVCVILWSVATMLMVFYTERSIGELANATRWSEKALCCRSNTLLTIST